jgi:hypothetical protein
MSTSRNSFFASVVLAFSLGGCAAPKATAPVPDKPAPSVTELPVAVQASVPKSNEGYTGTPDVVVSASVEAPKVSSEQLLQDGTALYDKGDYRGAIRKLISARDAAEDGSTVKKMSLRQLAFSYCVSSQRVLCKQQFAALLAIDPDFQLSRAEAGHPLWGPAFQEVKTASARAPKKK